MKYLRLLSQPLPNFKKALSSESLEDIDKLTVLAAVNNKQKHLESLLSKGANPNLITSQGSPILHTLLKNRRHLPSAELISLLFLHGADPFLMDSNGKLPIELVFRATPEVFDVVYSETKSAFLSLFPEKVRDTMGAVLDNLYAATSKPSIAKALFLYRKELADSFHISTPRSKKEICRRIIDHLFPPTIYPNLNQFLRQRFSKARRWKSKEDVRLLESLFYLPPHEKHDLDSVIKSNSEALVVVKFYLSLTPTLKRRFVDMHRYNSLERTISGIVFDGNPKVEKLLSSIENVSLRHRVFVWSSVFISYPDLRHIFIEFLESYVEGKFKSLRYRDFSLPTETGDFWFSNFSETVSFDEDFSSNSLIHSIEDFQNHLKNHLVQIGHPDFLNDVFGLDSEELYCKYFVNSWISREDFSFKHALVKNGLRAVFDMDLENLETQCNILAPHLHIMLKTLSARDPAFLFFDLNRISDSLKRHSFDELIFTFTDDFVDLFNIGKSPYFSSCQAYDYVSHLKIGVLGTLVNPWVKLFQLKNNKGIVVARAKAYLVKRDGEYGVVVDRIYGSPSVVGSFRELIYSYLSEMVYENRISFLSFDTTYADLLDIKAPVYLDVSVGGLQDLVLSKTETTDFL